MTSFDTTLSRDAFHARLRQIGTDRYHDKHPFHQRLHGGDCSPDEVRAWVINRWMYQSRIPMKDAAFLSRVEDPDLRRIWRSRIEDHDGGVTEGGGLRRWLALARAVGEYGSVIFIAGNIPLKTEIAPLLIVIQLEEFNYDAAASIGIAMLVVSFAMLLTINLIQIISRRRIGYV